MLGSFVGIPGRLVAVGSASSGLGRMPSSINKTNSTKAKSKMPAPMLPQPLDFLGAPSATAIGRAADLDWRMGDGFDCSRDLNDYL
jgi:hypothetical protein